jgi:hypothetical protein
VYAQPLPPQQPASNATAIGITVIASILVIALIGGLVWFLDGDGDPDDDPTGAISQNDPDTSEPDDPVTTEPDVTTTPAAEAQWNEVYSDYTVSLTTTFDSASTCQYTMVDFDDITTTGGIYYEYLTSDTPASYTDLILNPCDIDYATNTGLTNTLYTPAGAYGTFYDAAVTPDDCWTEIDANDPALNWTVDPWDPAAAPLNTGMMLCLYTANLQLVLAEVTSVTAETSENWMTVEFTTAVYAYS